MSFTLNSDGVKLTGAATGVASQAIEYNFAYLAAQKTLQVNREMAPSQLTGIWGYWDANLETPLTNGTLMSTITDQSGHGRHLTGAGASRATYNTNVFSTRPAFGFTAAANTIMGVASTLAQPTTVIIYGKRTSTSGSWCDGGALNTMRIFGGGSGTWQQYSAGGGSTAPKVRSYPCYMVSIYNPSGGSALWVNGNMQTQAEIAASSPNGFTLGNAFGSADSSDQSIEFAVVLNQMIDPKEAQKLYRWVQTNKGF
jgi:hypothetical protein